MYIKLRKLEFQIKYSHKKPFTAVVLFRVRQEQIAKFFSNTSLVHFYPQKPTITQSKSVSSNLDTPSKPSNADKASHQPPYTRLEYPRQARKTTLLERYAYENNRQNSTKSLYHSRKFRLYERCTFNEHIYY